MKKDNDKQEGVDEERYVLDGEGLTKKGYGIQILDGEGWTKKVQEGVEEERLWYILDGEGWTKKVQEGVDEERLWYILDGELERGGQRKYEKGADITGEKLL